MAYAYVPPGRLHSPPQGTPTGEWRSRAGSTISYYKMWYGWGLTYYILWFMLWFMMVKKPETKPETKQRRISRYRLGSGQVRPNQTIEYLEEIDTIGREWRIKEARQKNAYR